MIQKNEIVERRREIAELRHADSVFRDIQAREKEREDYDQRWFWELLQNAKDSVSQNDKVQVKVDVGDNLLSFSHTGHPFELDDILSLIIQGSSKANKEGKTGRFGTGFMTTYLLSKEVRISGTLINNKGCFSFLLNRSADTNDDFYRHQMESNDDFDNSIQETSYLGHDAFQTKFEYKLDPKGRQTAEIGLKSLDDLIPFTQLFNDQIDSVIVNRNGDETTYERQFISEITIKDKTIKEWSLDTIVNKQTKKKVTAYILSNTNYEIAFLTQKTTDGESVLRLNNEVPRLYFTFPLIGTEEIGIPFIINSDKFDPRVERDGVYLKDIDDEDDQTTNRQILREALLDASVVFSALIEERKINGEYEIFNYKQSRDYKWMDQQWFNSIKEEVIDELSSKSIIRVVGKSEPIAFENLNIPYSWKFECSEKFWILLSQNRAFNIPNFADTNQWVNIMENLCGILAQKIDDHTSVRNIADIIYFIENLTDLETLKQDLTVDFANWLNDFYSIVNSLYDAFPLDKKILLNQYSEFRKAEGMQWDDCKDSELIIISRLLSINFDQRFISNLINRFTIAGISNIDKQEAINELKNKVNDVKKQLLVENQIQEAIARMLRWLIDNRQVDVIRDLKILSGNNKSEEEFIFETFPKGRHLLLSPKLFFEQKFPLYANVIREKDCMHHIYHKILTNVHFEFLDKNGLIHLSPLVVRTEKIDLKTAELLIVKADDLSLLKDEEGKLKHSFDLMFSDFAYLTNTEGHIYDRSSTSKASLERFRFLLLEAVEQDTFFEDDIQEVEVESRKIKFYKQLWLYRAKKLQWVYVKNEGDDKDRKFSSELPSSKNLSELIKNEDALIKAIKGYKQQTFLNRLGVGVSDLIRNTLASDELRENWDKAITSMITSDVDPELVGEIFNDPGIQKEYEKRLNQRKIIKRNQNIGKIVEQLFRDIIVELMQSGFLIDIKRRPFGSDYIITDESSDLVNDNLELELFEINSWLVELKATGRAYAAMTPLQARTSTENKHNYALIVVPLNGTEPDRDYIKSNAIVISNVGEKIANIIGDFYDVEFKKNILFEGKDGISVNIEDQNVRFKIGSEVWEIEDFDTIEKFVHGKFCKELSISNSSTTLN